MLEYKSQIIQESFQKSFYRTDKVIFLKVTAVIANKLA